MTIDKKIVSPLFVILLIVVLDQATKLIALNFLPTLCNSGVAFGILGGGFRNEVLSLGTIFIVSWFFAKELVFAKKINYSLIGLSLLLGGGISNLLDRFIRGCVVDFVDFKFWPSFNLADIAISIGVGFLVLSFLRTNNHAE